MVELLRPRVVPFSIVDKIPEPEGAMSAGPHLLNESQDATLEGFNTNDSPAVPTWAADSDFLTHESEAYLIS